MNLLITKADFDTIGIILPKSLNEVELRRSIIESQEFDIKQHLGDLFYFDLLANATLDKYITLLNGEEVYEYQSYNYNYTGGLKAALCYYAYARYLPLMNKKATDFGLVTKKNEFSDQVSTAQLQLQINDARSAGYGYIQNMRKYLQHQAVLDNTLYPLWNKVFFDSSCADGPRPAARITKVGNI